MYQFQINRLIGVIFTPDFSITNQLKLLNIVASLVGDIFDGQPTVLPIPQDAPPDIPRIQLSSKDDKWRLSISLTRTEIAYLSPFQQINPEMVKRFTSLSSGFFSEYQRSIDVRVQRLAIITDRILFQENASEFIVEKFCKPELKQQGKPFNNTRAFEVHSLKKYEWEGFKINSWVRIRSNLREKDGAAFVNVTNDVNTLPQKEDPSKQFTLIDINRFFEVFPKHIEGIIEKYFGRS